MIFEVDSHKVSPCSSKNSLAHLLRGYSFLYLLARGVVKESIRKLAAWH